MTAPVLIAGGGPVGSTLALALSAAGVEVVLAEASAPGAPGPAAVRRPIALAAASVRILDTLGVWPAIAGSACPITMVHVSEQGRLGMVRLRAEEQGVAALGQVTDAAVIGAALERALAAAPRVRRLRPSRVVGVSLGPERVRATLDPVPEAPAEARLLVAAQGDDPLLRERCGIACTRRDYGQWALACTVIPGRAHGGVAYERFTPCGPLALLPLAGGACAVVWTLPEQRARALAEVAQAHFLDALEQAFGRRLGRLREAGPRQVFPLALERARRITGARLALAGNAANRLHPVAGQGLNLGLRDVAALAELVAGCVRAGGDPGAEALLAAYAQARRADHAAVVRFTDTLARAFTLARAPFGTLRSAGMLALDLLPPASRALARRAMGLAGRQPRLVRGVWP